MAEILDQSDIDALLNSSMDFDDDDDDESGGPEQDVPPKPSSRRIIKPVLERRLRFNYKYNSPVVKSEDFVFDPEDDDPTHRVKPVVWSIKNYNSRRSNKKRPSA